MRKLTENQLKKQEMEKAFFDQFDCENEDIIEFFNSLSDEAFNGSLKFEENDSEIIILKHKYKINFIDLKEYFYNIYYYENGVKVDYGCEDTFYQSERDFFYTAIECGLINVNFLASLKDGEIEIEEIAGYIENCYNGHCFEYDNSYSTIDFDYFKSEVEKIAMNEEYKAIIEACEIEKAIEVKQTTKKTTSRL